MLDPPSQPQRGAVAFPLLEVGIPRTSTAAMDSLTRLCFGELCPGFGQLSFALAPSILRQNGCHGPAVLTGQVPYDRVSAKLAQRGKA